MLRVRGWITGRRVSVIEATLPFGSQAQVLLYERAVADLSAA